jgi:hypothetical protein
MKETIAIYKLRYPNSYITKTHNAKNFVRYDDKFHVCKEHEVCDMQQLGMKLVSY